MILIQILFGLAAMSVLHLLYLVRDTNKNNQTNE